MEGIELLCFQIISAAGTSKSDFIEAVQEVKKGNFDKAEMLWKDGEQQYIKGHEVHAALLTSEANGNTVSGSVLMMHAEDQLMSAEVFQIIAKDFIDTYRRMIELEQKVNDITCHNTIYKP